MGADGVVGTDKRPIMPVLTSKPTPRHQTYPTWDLRSSLASGIQVQKEVAERQGFPFRMYYHTRIITMFNIWAHFTFNMLHDTARDVRS